MATNVIPSTKKITRMDEPEENELDKQIEEEQYEELEEQTKQFIKNVINDILVTLKGKIFVINVCYCLHKNNFVLELLINDFISYDKSRISFNIKQNYIYFEEVNSKNLQKKIQHVSINNFLQLMLQMIAQQNQQKENQIKRECLFLFVNKSHRRKFISLLNKKTWEVLATTYFYGMDTPIIYTGDYSQIQKFFRLRGNDRYSINTLLETIERHKAREKTRLKKIKHYKEQAKYYEEQAKYYEEQAKYYEEQGKYYEKQGKKNTQERKYLNPVGYLKEETIEDIKPEEIMLEEKETDELTIYTINLDSILTARNTTKKSLLFMFSPDYNFYNVIFINAHAVSERNNCVTHNNLKYNDIFNFMQIITYGLGESYKQTRQLAPWFDFLTEGCYDPRLLIYIEHFCDDSLKNDTFFKK